MMFLLVVGRNVNREKADFDEEMTRWEDGRSDWLNDTFECFHTDYDHYLGIGIRISQYHYCSDAVSWAFFSAVAATKIS